VYEGLRNILHLYLQYILHVVLIKLVFAMHGFITITVCSGVRTGWSHQCLHLFKELVEILFLEGQRLSQDNRVRGIWYMQGPYVRPLAPLSCV